MLQDQKAELLQARNAERQDNLMRATMSQGFKIDASNQDASNQKAEIPKAKKDDPMSKTQQSFAVIKDNYDGNIEEEKQDKDDKILDDDFLGDLKAVDVPDSDDECYL